MTKEQELKELVKKLWEASRFGTVEDIDKADTDLIRFYYENPEYFEE